MSTVVRPSGPLPPRVYWTRRVLFVVVLALLLWGLVRCAGGSDARQALDPGPSLTVPTSGGQTPDDERSRRQRRAALPPAGVRTVSAGFAPATQPCDPASVRVAPEVSGEARAGDPVPVQLRLSTASDAACTLQLDSGSMLVAVTSADEQVWSTARCTQAAPERSLVVQPRWSTLVEVIWSGGESCATGEGVVPPGRYTVQAALVEGEPAASDFEVEAPPPPERRHRGQDRRPRA